MRASVRPVESGLHERLGRYDLLIPIASGGMATVYLARTSGLGGFERDVAIKLMHPHLREHQEFGDDLIEEAKLCARIRHPNVVPVLDVASDRVGVYLVMDYVEGTSLSGLVKAGQAAGEPLPIAIALRILVDMLAGLHAAHELEDDAGRPLGLVHRDVSPQNVLVGLDGVARLTDFGIAKAATRISHTRTGTTKGKLAYMAPEQANAQPLDRRCDVWAAGVLAWELVAGRRLFSGTEASIVLDVISGKIPQLSEVRPGLPDGLAEAIHDALAVPAQSRCPTAAALRERIAAACTGPHALAEPDAVGGYVANVCGDQLRARRIRAREIATRRGPLHELVDAAPELTLTAADPSWLTSLDDDPPTVVARSATSSETMVSERVPSFRRRILPVAVAAVLLACGAAIGIASAMSGAAPEPAAASAPPSEPVASAPRPAKAAATTTAEALPVQTAAPVASSPSRAAKPKLPARQAASPRRGSTPFRNPYGE